jgi:hypothetical protein
MDDIKFHPVFRLRSGRQVLHRENFSDLSKGFFLDQWHLMFNLDNSESMSFREFKKIIPPKDRFWADPQVIQADGHYYIFVEEYIYKIGKAHISVIEIDKQGHLQRTGVCTGEGLSPILPVCFSVARQILHGARICKE